MLAPSWKNSETPRYYVITNDKMLEEMKENCLPPRNAQSCANAPVLIVTAFETGISGFDDNGQPVNECKDGWGYFDLGLACENLCLEACAQDLGTLIMGIRNESAIRKLLDVPESQQIVSVIAMGYPDMDPKKPERKKLKDVVKFF